MRILLLSDIHANLEALEACLAAAPEHDLVVNLGDIVGYCASPNEVTERSRALGGVVVRGNHDKACTGLNGMEHFNPVAAAAALWTRQALTAENLEWLKAMPAGPLPLADGATEDSEQARPAVHFAHGSPFDEDEYVITVRDAMAALMRASARITFLGHTHLQGGFSLDVDHGALGFKPQYHAKKKAETFRLELDPEAKYLLNPGSVGQPRDGDWRAGFALFESDERVVTFYRQPYDLESAQQRILDAGLPERLATRLSFGR